MRVRDKWARLWYSLRLALAEFIDPSLIAERDKVRATREEAGATAHRAFHALWTHVASGRPYDKRLWNELHGLIATLGVRASARPQDGETHAELTARPQVSDPVAGDRRTAESGGRAERAEGFCGTALLLSIAGTHPLLDRLGTLEVGLAVKRRGLLHWNFAVVAASAGVALSSLEREVSAGEFETVRASLYRCTGGSVDGDFRQLWTLHGPTAIEDCVAFVRKALTDIAPGKAKAALSHAVGTWVIRYILGKEPSTDDLELAASLGHLIASTYAAYWYAA